MSVRMVPPIVVVTARLRPSPSRCTMGNGISVCEANMLASKMALGQPKPSNQTAPSVPSTCGIRKVSEPNTRLGFRYRWKSSRLISRPARNIR